jgi:hypothetical protein
LRLPVDNQSNRGQLAQLVKEHFPKGDVEADILKMCRGRTVNLVVQVDDSALELSLVEPAPRLSSW